jgi:hypothetical protein
VTPGQVAFTSPTKYPSGQPTRPPIFRIFRAPSIRNRRDGIEDAARNGATLPEQLLHTLFG